MGGQILNEGEEGSQQKEWEGDESITAIGPGSIAMSVRLGTHPHTVGLFLLQVRQYLNGICPNRKMCSIGKDNTFF